MKTSFVVYLVALMTALSALPFLAQGQEGLVGHWEFEGNAADSSGNGYNGEENGDVAYAAGKFGQALDLENDAAYVVVPNNVDMQLKSTDTYTVAAYLHPSDTSHGAILYHGLGCSTWASWFLGMQGAEPDATLVPDSFVFGVRAANGGTYTGISADAGSGEWIHVAATFDGSVLTIYVDSEEIDSMETELPYDSTENLFIGGDSGCGGRAWYTGLLDDVRIYNRALPKSEIVELAEHGGAAVSSSGKLATTWADIKK